MKQRSHHIKKSIIIIPKILHRTLYEGLGKLQGKLFKRDFVLAPRAEKGGRSTLRGVISGLDILQLFEKSSRRPLGLTHYNICNGSIKISAHECLGCSA